MDKDSEKLKEVLQSWKTVEPSKSFEQNVWRRMRNAESQVEVEDNRWSWLRVRPILVRGLAAGFAAVIAVLAGLAVGSRPENADVHVSANLFTMLPDTSISASFLSMKGGGL